MAKPPVKRKSLLPETKKKRTVADAVGKKIFQYGDTDSQRYY